MVTGVAGGAFSGLGGAGGGAIMAPLLTGQPRLSQHRAHGTSLAVITFVAIAGALGYWRAGNVDLRVVAALVPGSVAGGYASASAMTRVPALQLRLLFGAFCSEWRAASWCGTSQPAVVRTASSDCSTRSYSANRLDGDVVKFVYRLTALFLGCQIFYSTIRAYGPRMMEQTI
jgi:hypothetical protein